MKLDQIESGYDIVIVGGRVTGAGVFHQAVGLHNQVSDKKAL